MFLEQANPKRKNPLIQQIRPSALIFNSSLLQWQKGLLSNLLHLFFVNKAILIVQAESKLWKLSRTFGLYFLLNKGSKK